MVKPSEVAEQAVANNWLTILARGSMIVCAFSLPVVWGWAGGVDADRSEFRTAIKLIEAQTQARKDEVARNEAALLVLGARISVLEVAGGRSDAQQQAVQDDVKEILARITRIEEGLGRRGEIPGAFERADARQ